MYLPALVGLCALLAACGVAQPKPEADVPQPSPVPERVFATDLEGHTEHSGSKPVAVADEQAPDPEHMCDQLPPKDERNVDYARRKLEETTCSVALWLDGLLGADTHYEAARSTAGKVQVFQTYSEFYGSRSTLRFSANVDMPNVDKRLSAFIGRDNTEDFVSDRQERSDLRSSFPQMVDDDRWLAGLGYALPGSDLFKSNIRVGVSGIGPPKLFLQNRNYLRAYSDHDQLVYLRGTPFWDTEDGFGVTVGLNYSRVLSDRQLLRWSNAGTVSQDGAEGMDWRTALTLYQGLRKERGLAWEAFVRGETADDVHLHEYGLETRYRHPFIAHRLYGRWALGYSFPREDQTDDREGSVGVGFGLELPFGQGN